MTTWKSNISTKSYLEAALSTPTRANRIVTDNQSAKAFHQRHHSTLRSYIILDNQSTVNVFWNSALLQNIHASDRTLHVSCNDGTVTVNQVHDLPWYGQFWYQPKGISNILGLSNVADNDKYLVRYESQESKNFIITRTKGGKENLFCRASRGLQWIDAKSTKTGEDGEVLINTVEANNFSFTRRSYLRAKLARKI